MIFRHCCNPWKKILLTPMPLTYAVVDFEVISDKQRITSQQQVETVGFTCTYSVNFYPYHEHVPVAWSHGRPSSVAHQVQKVKDLVWAQSASGRRDDLQRVSDPARRVRTGANGARLPGRVLAPAVPSTPQNEDRLPKIPARENFDWKWPRGPRNVFNQTGWCFELYFSWWRQKQLRW